MAFTGQFQLENILPGLKGQTLGTNLTIDLSGSTLTLPASQTITSPVITTGLTASGSASNDFSGSTGTFKFPSGAATNMRLNVIDSNAATLTLTAAQSNSLVLLDRAAGTTITLPAPVVGLNFNFVVTTAVTSNNHKVITDAGTTFILGGVAMVEAADTNSGLGALFNGTTHISILMNGTTTGGIIGTAFNLSCVTSTQWSITGVVAGSGTLATCASTS